MEIQFLEWLQTLHTPVLDRLMVTVTSLGNGGIFWIALALILLLFGRTRQAGMAMGLALLMGLIVGNLILKPLVNRVRPYEVAQFTQLLISRPIDASFPSGHTQASFAGAVALLCHDKRGGIAACILAALIAFSRLYLFVHYPTDVLGGMLLGILWGLLASALMRRVAGNEAWREKLKLRD